MSLYFVVRDDSRGFVGPALNGAKVAVHEVDRPELLALAAHLGVTLMPISLGRVEWDAALVRGVIDIAAFSSLQGAQRMVDADTTFQVRSVQGQVLYDPFVETPPVPPPLVPTEPVGPREIVFSEGQRWAPNGAGDEVFRGNDLVNTITVRLRANDIEITRNPDGSITTVDRVGMWGTDIYHSIERLQFGDAMVAFDVDGNAGMAYRIYQTMFDRAPDRGGLGFWIGELDAGTHTLFSMALGFVTSDEFAARYGSPATVTDADFVTLLYANVLGRAPDAGGLAHWTGALDAGMGWDDVIVGFSESAENKANLAAAVADGIWYT